MIFIEESLGGTVHDLVGKLGLCNVLPQLLDASASGLGSSVLVNHLVTFILGGNSVLQSSNKLFDDLKLSTEERVLAGVHGVLSILRRSRLTPGTVSTSPSKEALIWNSLN